MLRALLCAEVWLLWHFCICVCAHYTYLFPGLEYALLVFYLAGTFLYLRWIRQHYARKRQRLGIVLLSQLPLFVLSLSAYLLFADVFYLDAVIVSLQYFSAIFLPLHICMPQLLLHGVQLYLWSAVIILNLQSLGMLLFVAGKTTPKQHTLPT